VELEREEEGGKGDWEKRRGEERLTVAMRGSAVVGCAVVFRKDSSPVLGAEDDDGVDRE
jgi:hypothetical protein